jgi:DNA-binding CsgD family transcriptional regulator
VTEHFETRLYEAFLAAAADREQIKVFRDLAKQHPAAGAAAVCDAIPLLMQDKRKRVNESYGIDLADQKWKEQAKQKRLNLVEEILLLMAANTYLVFKVCQAKLDAYANDTSLSGEDRAIQVCTAGIEVLEATEAVLLHARTELRAEAQSVGGSDEIELARDAEASRLAGHLATRTSSTINKKLAHALDEIRRYDKPTGRARLEALLRELYVEAPEVWSKHSRTDWQLRATRTEVAKKLVWRYKPSPQEIELATFAEREALLKWGRETGLPPREYELLRLVMGNPKRFFRNDKLNHREVAREMDLAVGTIKSLWSRIRKTLAA